MRKVEGKWRPQPDLSAPQGAWEVSMNAAARAPRVLPARADIGRRAGGLELSRRSAEGREGLSDSPEEVMLRHTLATLAYRAGKVLRDAPEEFGAFQAVRRRPQRRPRSWRTWATSWTGPHLSSRAKQSWKDSPPQPWDADVRRFFDSLARLDAVLAGPLGAGALRPSACSRGRSPTRSRTSGSSR